MSCAAMPATIGAATLVPVPVIPLAVRTPTAGAETFGLLKSPFGLKAPDGGSTYELPSPPGLYQCRSSPRDTVFRSSFPPTVRTFHDVPGDPTRQLPAALKLPAEATATRRSW